MSPTGAPNDREQRVEDGHTKDEQRDEQRGKKEVRLTELLLGDWVGTASDNAGGRGHQQAEQQRPSIAHEDLGGVEVVRHEAKADTHGDDAHQRTDAVVGEQALVLQFGAVQKERA